jgi:patatin-related protein
MNSTPSGPAPRSAYASEVRFGVVMYGGVSLAIYINGVANELYEMNCATPKADGAAVPGGSTREVYRKLSWLLRNPALREQYLAHLQGRAADPFEHGDPADPLQRDERVRFVVDVIAGTSAGGINGIFLAKALANGEAFAPLKQMWVQEGDIAGLLNDKLSYEGIAFAQTDAAPRSLLNSDRMYLKLLQAMDAMAPAVPPVGHGESALSDELDLYVTTTDIRGTVVPLRLFDSVVYEKRHKQVYHFQYVAAGGQVLANDLRPANNAFLAFTARCTSSFPFAFEPMQVADAERLGRARLGGGGIDVNAWKPFFGGLSDDDMASGRWRQRAFGDGGYLDNKPFSYVVEALSWRLAAVPMERKLIYVEPAPAHPERERQQFDDKPDAIENAVDALTHIPQYETIREDLEAVLRRNRRIERVERIVRKVESDVDTLEEEPFVRIMVRKGAAGDDEVHVPEWSTLDLGDMIAYYGVAFLPYRRLRLTTVSDDLADRLATRWGVDRRSDRLYAMRALVRAWREERYHEHRKNATPTQTESINAYLADFDVKYRVRRVGFLLRKTHQLMRVVQWLGTAEERRAPLSESEAGLLARLEKRVPDIAALQPPALRAALLTLRDHFAPALSVLRQRAWPAGGEGVDSGTPAQRAQLGQVLALLMGETLASPLRSLPDVAGADVPLLLDTMPLPSPLRTLQENVYQRANGLFEAARRGRRTQLQALLEADLDTFRITATGTAAASPPGTAPPLLAKELLGRPTLRVAKSPSLSSPDRRKIVIDVADVADARVSASLNTPEGRALRGFLAEYYLRFDEYDQVSFPLYYDTGTGEPATVEVVRVSPEDAPSLIDEGREPRRKLAGTFLFNFGGFLDAQWRRNDIMWGRLDASERLFATLLPAAGDQALREALLGQAQRAILREEMTQPFYAELVSRFTLALKEQRQASLGKDFAALLQALAIGDGQNGTRVALALKAVLGDEGLFDFVKNEYEVRRDLDTETTLKTGARAITITGRILEQIEQRQRGRGSRMVWVTRAGRAFQALLAVSTPGSLLRRLARHWLALLYSFEALVVLAAVLFNEPATRNFALSALGVTVVLHLALLVTGDLLQRRFSWARGIAGVLAAVALAAAVVGASGLLHYGPVALLCGPVEKPPTGVPGWVCARLR